MRVAGTRFNSDGCLNFKTRSLVLISVVIDDKGENKTCIAIRTAILAMYVPANSSPLDVNIS